MDMVEGNNSTAAVAFQQLARGIRTPQFGSLVALAAVFTLGIGLIQLAKKPSFVPLYNASETPIDASQVVGTLGASSLEYRIDPASGMVLVPRAELQKARTLLASDGFGAPASVGLELLHNEQSLGTSQFMQNARYHHGLETELSRTISQMRNVKQARVHLALPKQSVFIRNRAKASASVMVHAMPGRVIETGQVAAIANIVASSIPYLESSAVTVVDRWGRMLTSGANSAEDELTRTQFDYTRKLENLLSSRIESLLEPIIGAGKVRASVTAEVDFTSDEQTEELYQSDPENVRSEETRKSSQAGNPRPTGVAGALGNQPGAATPEGPAAGESGDEYATRNYELDRTVRHTRRMPGKVLRLSAAVLIDQPQDAEPAAAAEGEAADPAGVITDELLQEVTQLAREAIGFDEARGDSVYVIQRPFQSVEEEVVEPESTPIWQQYWFADVLKQLAIGIALLVLVFKVVLPSIKTLRTPAAATAAGRLESGAGKKRKALAASDDDEEDEDSVGENVKKYGDILNVAKALAEEDPARVARVVKEWVGDTT
jgi:flagellar M-ring protein FliF